MDNADKRINDIIESEDHERFNMHAFTGKTRKLMIQLHHLAAREDMIYPVYNGRFEVSDEFMELILEYRQSVRDDMRSLVENIQNTKCVI